MKLYEYKNCSTCKAAIKFLTSEGVAYEKAAIIDTPPSMAELKKMLQFVKNNGGTFKNLFNTSGEQYRSLNISEKIKAGLEESEALSLLAKNGKLIKRPFFLSDKFGLLGFKVNEWKKHFK